MVGEDPHRVRGRGCRHHPNARQLGADEARTLAAGLRVREHHLDLRELERGARDQALADRVHHLADDRHVLGLHGQRIERGVDRPFQRVLDRHQCALDGTVVDGHHCVIDRGKRDRFELGVRRGGEHRLVRERALGPQVADAHRAFQLAGEGR